MQPGPWDLEADSTFSGPHSSPACSILQVCTSVVGRGGVPFGASLTCVSLGVPPYTCLLTDCIGAELWDLCSSPAP